MSYTPHWLNEDETGADEGHPREFSLIGVIAWIVAIVVTADCLFVAQRFFG
jgi:hypothetical protein